MRWSARRDCPTSRRLLQRRPVAGRVVAARQCLQRRSRKRIAAQRRQMGTREPKYGWRCPGSQRAAELPSVTTMAFAVVCRQRQPSSRDRACAEPGTCRTDSSPPGEPPCSPNRPTRSSSTDLSASRRAKVRPDRRSACAIGRGRSTTWLVTWLLVQSTPTGEAFPAQPAGFLMAGAGMLAGSLAPQWVKGRHGTHHNVVGVHS